MHLNNHKIATYVCIGVIMVALVGLTGFTLAIADEQATSTTLQATTTDESLETQTDAEGQTDIADAEESTATSSEETDTKEQSNSNQQATTTVTTGDATAVGSADNNVNSNDVTSTSTTDTATTSASSSNSATTTGSTTASSADITQPSASSTPVVHGTSTDASNQPTATTTDSQLNSETATQVNASSSASLNNDVTVEADTGNNTATASDQSVSIKTGDATAYARILNQVNTNTVQSSGTVRFLNNLVGNISKLDFRSAPVFVDSNKKVASDCSQSSACNNGTTTITNNNKADITNKVVSRATTGGNMASGSSASIDTGDAYAAADVVNLANTNIINSSYLLFSFHNFGSWDGDLVFPNKETVGDQFSGSADNGAVMNTGKQTTSSDDQNKSIGTMIDNSNANVAGADQFAVALRVHGDWTGEVFNAPDSLQWSKGDDGLRVFTIGSGSSTNSGLSDAKIVNNNKAEVDNNVSVQALTGSNQASSTGSSSVTTGKARAASNVINVVNTNVVGQNMLLGILNIFGDWDGNISFGQPDIWVGGVANTERNSRLRPGSSFDVTYDVVNRGDADAHNVVLDINAGRHLQLMPNTASSSSATKPASDISVGIGSIPAGESVQVKATMQIDDDLSAQNESSETTAEANLKETDANPDNNREMIALSLNQAREAESSPSGIISSELTRSSGSDDGRVLGIASSDQDNSLHISHTAETGTTTATTTAVTYSMQVKNNSDSKLSKGMVTDRLLADNNEVLNEEAFRLGDIYPQEEINISYTTVLTHGTTPAVHNEAHLKAMHDGQVLESNTATSTVTLPTVAGRQVSTVNVCNKEFDDYIWANRANDDSAVRKLQRFMNQYRGTDLEVTGRYNQKTQQAVERFQQQYADEVLAPWGIDNPTGNVYRTTVKKMNDIACGNSVRMDDIKRLKDALHNLQSVVAALPTKTASSSRKTRELAQTQQ